MFNRQAIKAHARQIFSRNRWPLIGAFILAILLPGCCLGGSSGFGNSGTYVNSYNYSYNSGNWNMYSNVNIPDFEGLFSGAGALLPIVFAALAVGLVIVLIIGLAMMAITYLGEAAYARMSLMAYDGVPVKIEDLFGIKGYWLKAIGLYFVIALRILAWMLVPYLFGIFLLVLGIVAAESGQSLMAAVMAMCVGSLLAFASFVLAIMASLRYMLAPYLLFEDSSKGINQLIRESKALMNGYKWEMFVFYLSFLGWLLLIPITLGLAVFYVGPYLQLSLAGAYRAIRYLQAQKTGIMSPGGPVEPAADAFGAPTPTQYAWQTVPAAATPAAAAVLGMYMQQSIDQVPVMPPADAMIVTEPVAEVAAQPVAAAPLVTDVPTEYVCEPEEVVQDSESII